MQESVVTTPIDDSANGIAQNDAATIANNEEVIEKRINFAFSDGETPPASEENNEPNNDSLVTVEPIITPPVVNPYKDLGFETAEEIKAELESLRAKSQQQTDKYENEESKKVHKLILEGKIKDVINIYKTQEELEIHSTADVNKDSAEGIIKLGIHLKNPKLTPGEIDFQYREEYLPPKEPTQKRLEDDDEFEERVQEWKERCEKLEMKKIIAAKMTQPELESAKQKIQLPDISVPQSAEKNKELDAYMASSAQEQKFLNEVIIPSISSLKEDDVKMVIELNDPKSQMQFKVSITPSKEHLQDAKNKAINWDNYLQNTVYDKDGNFLSTRAAQIILRNDYFDEYAQSIARQSVNAERISKVEERKNNGSNGSNGNRDFVINGQSDIDAMMNYRMS